MYGYEEYTDISPEQILQKVTQEQIFEFILKEPVVIGTFYKSPCRTDKNAGCRFELRPDGTLIFVDFGEKFLTGRTHRTCFGLVQDSYKVNLTSAMRIICNHFGISKSSSDYKQLITNTIYEKSETARATISYDARPINKNDILFWSQFIIRPEHLEQDNTYCVIRYRILSHKGYKIFNAQRHAYAFDFVDRVKIYQPYQTKYRFISTCDENNIGNFDNLPATGEELIIQKSYKDHRVLRNVEMGLNVIWLQSEGCIPSMEILVNLIGRFKLITVFYDSDEDGVKAAMKLVDILNSIKPDCARLVHLPVFVTRNQMWKDPGDFVKKEGRSDLITVLKQIGIYGKDT